MMYRNFAIATLIAAPLIVLTVQSVVPQAQVQPAQIGPSTVTQIVMPPVPAPYVTQVSPAPVADPQAFGQPMVEAGQPILAPGGELTQAVAPPIVGAAPPFPLEPPPPEDD